MTGISYDRIGRSYSATRRADPRLAAAIWDALGSAATVLKVEAGAGAYEPPREVTAVEPSAVMIAQRPMAPLRSYRHTPRSLPFADRSFDVATAVLSDFHWRDRQRGLRELRRVASQRVVVFNANPGEANLFWLPREYLRGFLDLIPACHRAAGARGHELRAVFGNLTLIAIPIPHDCVGGFYGAICRRPAAYLDQSVRDGISVFAQLPAAEVDAGLAALSSDLDSGDWQERHPIYSRYLFTSGITSRSPNAMGPTEPLVASPAIETERCRGARRTAASARRSSTQRR